MAPHVGDIVGGYRLAAEIGSGGYGAVWRAEDRGGRAVALKFLRRGLGESATRRFLREGQILANLEHPHCVRFVEVVHHGDQVVIVTELVEGETLRTWHRAAPRTVPEILEVTRQIVAGLEAAHRLGVIHRDLKPANIMVSTTRAGLRVRILDFGVATLIAEEQRDITKTGEVIGTPGFMSPEQLLGERSISAKSDLYCLGTILFELLEGHPPFSGPTPLAVSMAHLMEPVPPQTRPDTPPHVVELIEGLLAKEAFERPSAANVVRQLEGRDAPVVETAPPYSKKELKVAALLVFVIIVGGVAVWSSRRPAPPLERRMGVLPIPAPPTEPSSKIAPPPPKQVVERSPGCGHMVPLGRRPVTRLVGLERKTIEHVYVPKSYDPNRPSPAVVVFPEHGQTATELLAELHLEPLADQHALVVVAMPEAHRNIVRELGVDEVLTADIEAQLAALPELLCIDEQRIWGFGHGVGGAVSDILGCKGYLSAVATSAYRLDRDHVEWGCARAVPRLLLTAAKDEVDPVEGDGGVVSLTEHEAKLRTWNRCADKPTLLERQPVGATCTTWNCEATVISCLLDTKYRHWPGYERHDGTSKSVEYDYHAEIWRFFSEVATDPGQRNPR